LDIYTTDEQNLGASIVYISQCM